MQLSRLQHHWRDDMVLQVRLSFCGLVPLFGGVKGKPNGKPFWRVPKERNTQVAENSAMRGLGVLVQPLLGRAGARAGWI